MIYVHGISIASQLMFPVGSRQWWIKPRVQVHYMKHSVHLVGSEMKLLMHLYKEMTAKLTGLEKCKNVGVTRDEQKPEDNEQDPKVENSPPDVAYANEWLPFSDSLSNLVSDLWMQKCHWGDIVVPTG
ncbi:Uncharacterized protein Fot_17871 [Forsythia ovata]|uniref:Uncharacterized protein n=1 Tax=Forsythia ovata TaxID=205694 RepID=A0ABD1VJA5_9LAMI